MPTIPRVHAVTHVSHEDLGVVHTWLKDKKHVLTFTRTYKADPFPNLDSFDWLIVLGGPMSVCETQAYPWLTPEKQFIKTCIQAHKKILGICLGAQLIAEVLGSRVTQNPYREIGWFKVERLLASSHPFAAVFPDELEVFHWHHDTFEIPKEALPLAKSEACQNQGFLYHEHVIGLQFHLEVTLANVQSWTEQGKDEWKKQGPYIQSREEMTKDITRFERANQTLYRLLDYLEKKRTTASPNSDELSSVDPSI